MTDYTKRTGTTGTLMIRDDGDYIELWINSGNSSTAAPNLPWAFVLNGGASVVLYYNYRAGSGWERLWRERVTYSQTVTLKIGNTGTAGFGGPTTLSVSIIRAQKPDAPIYVSLTDITAISFHAEFKDGSANNAPIDARQVGYGTNDTTPQKTINATGTASSWTVTVTGLQPGIRHYFWGRTHNVKGWSPWTSRLAFTTLSVVRVNIGGVWKHGVPYVKHDGVWKVAQPWTRNIGVWKQAK